MLWQCTLIYGINQLREYVQYDQTHDSKLFIFIHYFIKNSYELADENDQREARDKKTHVSIYIQY